MTDKQLLDYASDRESWTDDFFVEVGERLGNDADESFLLDLLGRLEQAGLDAVSFSNRISAARSHKEQESTAEDTLDKYHTIVRGKPSGVYDYAIMKEITEHENILIIGGIPYIYKAGVFIPDRTGSKLYGSIRAKIYPQFQKAATEKRIFDLVVRTDAIQTEFDEMNAHPEHWINFKNGFWDPIDQRMIKHSPKYKSVNQIPHEYHPEQRPTGDNIEAWLQFIVPEPDERQMLLEYCGYCMTTDTRQQVFLILVGLAGTGKSTLIKLLEHIIGGQNISHVSLKELTQRFSSYGLMGKTLNSCADLEVSALEDVSLLKKALGEDGIRVEAKGKDAIDIHNYAKLIFSTNELPLVLSEKTDGFFRRLLVLSMNRKPPESRPDFFTGLMQETDYFIHICMDALHEMYQRGKITQSAGSREAVANLRRDSDTVEAWLAEKCTLDESAKTDRGRLFVSYDNYCIDNERTSLSKQGFFRALRTKGYTEKKIKGTRMFAGIAIGKGGTFSEAKTAPQYQKVVNLEDPVFD